jgi:hypothetical protein
MTIAGIVSNAKDAFTRGNRSEASDLLNFSLIKLGELTMDGVKSLEGTTVDRWKERVWNLLEDWDMMED